MVKDKFNNSEEQLNTRNLQKNELLKNIEDVLIFYGKQPTYNQQRGEGEAYTIIRKNYKGSECHGSQRDHDTINTGGRCPTQLIEFSNRKGKNVHPTQKPVALMEYLIKTYTNEGDTVLDFAMGSGTTMVACKNTGRNGIGIELDETYFNIAEKRIENA